MKKLTLLLTSLLLAGAASAAVLDFEHVETHQDTSVDLNQDFQVAHPCVGGRVHVNDNEHTWDSMGFDHRNGKGYCAHVKGWIKRCHAQNRPVATHEKCGEPCQPGMFPDTRFNYLYSNYCNATAESCAAVGRTYKAKNSSKRNRGKAIYFGWCYPKKEPCPPDRPHWQSFGTYSQCVTEEAHKTYKCWKEDKIYSDNEDRCQACVDPTPIRDYNTCHPCPAAHKWKPEHKKCVKISELESYCNGRDEVYIIERDRCEKCAEWHPIRVGNKCTPCPPNTSWQPAHNKCVAFSELRNYCEGEDEIYVVERDRCEKCAAINPATPVRVGGECAPCPPNTAWQTEHNKCVATSELASFCNSRDEVYVAERNRCERCAPHHPHRGANRCFTDRAEALTYYCSTIGKLYNNTSDRCDTEQANMAWCNGRDEVYIAERNRCEKCAEWHPIRAGNECVSCPPNTAWQKAHNKCVSFDELEAFCNNRPDGQAGVYNPETNDCGPCPRHLHRYIDKKDGRCVDYGRECKKIGKSLDIYSGECVATCPEYLTLNEHNVCASR